MKILGIERIEIKITIVRIIAAEMNIYFNKFLLTVYDLVLESSSGIINKVNFLFIIIYRDCNKSIILSRSSSEKYTISIEPPICAGFSLTLVPNISIN